VAENLKIDFEQNSKYRVALELAYKIASAEGKSTGGEREYWLKLYHQTRTVVLNGTMPQL
jgi:hypothetical protein